MPIKLNEKGYYNDSINYRFTISIRDKYFTNKIIRRSFPYRDNYCYTKLEAEYNAIKLSKYLLEVRKYKEKALIEYLNDIKFVDHRWD